MIRLLLSAALLASIMLMPHRATAGDEEFRPNRLTVYHTWYSPDRMIEILQLNATTSGHSRFTALAYSRRLGPEDTSLSWEIEGQVGRHSGRQTHPEANLLVAARWNRFPWDSLVDTSAALGWGLSYAFEVPPLEPRSDRDERSTRLLNYLLVELDFARPATPQWGLVLRLHHRSGVFGTFSGVDGGSNFIGGGIRYSY